MNTEKLYRVLLYYKYVDIKNPEEVTQEHKEVCTKIGLKGRIHISKEGINGTCSGTVEQTDQYIEYMRNHPLFHDIFFKIDEHDGHAFKKLHVRHRPEIVTWRLGKELKPHEKTGTHLSPKEFNELLKKEDVIVLDGRNDYEYDLGHFRGAIRPEVETTKDFPKWIQENLGQYKDKKIITYCTGGIRCEMLTAYMLEEGFQDVSQLDGGIVTYGKDPEVKGELFDGKLYVFDERISVPVNQVEEVVVGKCYHCGTPAEKYINCKYDICHHQHIVCPECDEQHHGYCKPECEEKDRELQASKNNN
ncbi:oxygen-dependent tRNA uridine(34) hydroxylase TrhO [Risungbinella massiliensis]|uniref:oxygen-dependent tRNA uridine(34) hydroxylase TrhO n=1 Tax=Risungbinella massiliensis TaxID=1329796 RepID=UPI0005CBE76B|nr:rhodanese-related sulfurtransferase [Risungbinella massiliensis]